MGSGGMIVVDENTCMVDLAKYYMNFLRDESCGKCYSCRKGTQRMHEILEDISRGEGTMDKLQLLEDLAVVVKDVSMCGLGQTSTCSILRASAARPACAANWSAPPARRPALSGRKRGATWLISRGANTRLLIR